MTAAPVTRADVFTVFYQLQDTCKRLGMIEAADHIDLQVGSDTQAWRLFSLTPISPAPIFGFLPDSSFLGKNNREAIATLRGIIAGLEAAFQHEDRLSASLLRRPRPILKSPNPYGNASTPPPIKGGLMDGLL